MVGIKANGTDVALLTVNNVSAYGLSKVSNFLTVPICALESAGATIKLLGKSIEVTLQDGTVKKLTLDVRSIMGFINQVTLLRNLSGSFPDIVLYYTFQCNYQKVVVNYQGHFSTPATVEGIVTLNEFNESGYSIGYGNLD